MLTVGISPSHYPRRASTTRIDRRELSENEGAVLTRTAARFVACDPPLSTGMLDVFRPRMNNAEGYAAERRYILNVSSRGYRVYQARME